MPRAVSLSEMAPEFAISPQRRIVLDGFLRYRARLHAAGLVAGFQWLNCDFSEDMEPSEGQPPPTLQVVTFFRLQPGVSQLAVVAHAGLATNAV